MNKELLKKVLYEWKKSSLFLLFWIIFIDILEYISGFDVSLIYSIRQIFIVLMLNFLHSYYICRKKEKRR